MSERIEQAVIADQRNKIALGAELEQAIEEESVIESALREARARTVKARRAALRGGWDEKMLRQLGLLGKKPVSSRKKTAEDSAPTGPANETPES